MILSFIYGSTDETLITLSVDSTGNTLNVDDGEEARTFTKTSVIITSLGCQ